MQIGRAISVLISTQTYHMNDRKAQGGATFQDQLAAASGQTDPARPAQSANTVPANDLLQGYEAWKSQQPPHDLPDSQGLTEENLAYLAERYPGSSFTSLNEAIDALHTMRDMGIVDQAQFDSQMNTWASMSRTTGTQTYFRVGPLEEPTAGGMDSFSLNLLSGLDMTALPPLPDFKKADELMAWLDKLFEN